MRIVVLLAAIALVLATTASAGAVLARRARGTHQPNGIKTMAMATRVSELCTNEPSPWMRAMGRS